MAIQTYGLSWWGQQWLNALMHIDADNRLPRGRTYANKGAVQKLDIKDGHIRAQVRGSYIYTVEITVPPFSGQEKERLLDALVNDPLIISQLLNRELSPTVLDLANETNIKIFPASWKDLHMDCNCPDWAVPCKHLAAVIYLISRQIDSDPFLVFALHGLDLPTALRQRGMDIDKKIFITPPSLSALFANQPFVHEEKANQGLDFTLIPALHHDLLRLLPDNPVFYPFGDFHQVYSQQLARLVRYGEQLQKIVPESESQMQWALGATESPMLRIDGDYRCCVQGITHLKDLSTLLGELKNLTPRRLQMLQPSVAGLHLAWQFAVHLLAKGAVMPQVFSCESETLVRWLPATLDVTVDNLLEQVARQLPDGLISFNDWALTGKRQAITLCSLMLDRLVQSVPLKKGDTPYDKLFFLTGRVTFDSRRESASAASIAQWLSRLTLVHREQPPVIMLDEAGEDFALHLAVKITDQPAPVMLADILWQKCYENTRMAVLQTLAMLAEFYPPLCEYLRAGGRQALRLTAQTLPDFLFTALPVIRMLGIQALLPKALDKILRPRLSMQVRSSSGAGGSSGFQLGNLFDFDWRIALGDRQLTVTEFETLIDSAEGIVRFKEQFIYLDPDEIARLRNKLLNPPDIKGMALTQTALSGEYAGTPIMLDSAAREQLRQLTSVGMPSQPVSLNATLRPYQQTGFAWLTHNLALGIGGILADDMGLGKTLQLIAVIQHQKETGALAERKVLIIMPTTLLTNWQREIARFAPTLTTAIYHGGKRALSDEMPDILLTTYGVVRSDAATLKKQHWRLVAADEAQNLKNPASAQTKAAKSIPADAFIALSGTPVENRLAEYWSIMDFALRGYLGPLKTFISEIEKPIQMDRNQQVAERFRRITAPFLLRRLKSDKTIISDLPEKIETDRFCELATKQAAIYASVVREGMQVIRGESDAFQRQGLVLQMIMALKQVCNHPAHYLKNKQMDAALSGKAQLLLDLLDSIEETTEKVLIFTQFKEMGELLQSWLTARYGEQPLFLHGGLSRKKRDEQVERFQNDRSVRHFILSLKAGGTGLNLTAASQVIHYDLWWNPAVEAQATDRAYRIGQQRNVQVHRLLTRETFEERINDMIRNKKALAEMTVGSGEQWLGKMTDDELEELFRAGQD
ncbi:TPA: helicase SNF2 [Escherichia coli]|nr:helicase SNF2 [Escherichia coli]